MSEKNSTLNELNQITDKNALEIKGKRYIVNAMPLAYVREYMEEPAPLQVSHDDSNVRVVMFNFYKIPNGKTAIDMEAITAKWVPRLLEYNGQPCTLDLLKEHKWDICDFNDFLKKALSISD